MGKSKKKVIDLKPEKVSEEQLQELQQVVSAVNNYSLTLVLWKLENTVRCTHYFKALIS